MSRPAGGFLIPVQGFIVSGSSEAELAELWPRDFTWPAAPDSLQHQDSQGAYIDTLLGRMATTLQTETP